MFFPLKKKTTTLYFIKGSSPTAEELADAATYGTKMFRNASQVQDTDRPEKCDFVAGAIPPAYAAIPKAEPLAPVAPAPEPAIAQEPAEPAPELEPVVPNVAKRGKTKK